MTDSRPQIEAETERIKADMLLHANHEGNWRIKLAEAIATSVAQGRYFELWARTHDQKDDEREMRTNQKFLELSKKVTGVSSSIHGYDLERAELKGARKLILGFVAIVGGLGGLILFAIEVIRFIRGDK